MKQVILGLLAIFLLSGCSHQQVEYKTPEQKEIRYEVLQNEYPSIFKDVDIQRKDIEKYLTNTNLLGSLSLKTIDQTNPYINIVYKINEQVQLTFSYHETKHTLVSISAFSTIENSPSLKIMANAIINIDSIHLDDQHKIQVNAFINDIDKLKENKIEIKEYTLKSINSNYLQFQILFS